MTMKYFIFLILACLLFHINGKKIQKRDLRGDLLNRAKELESRLTAELPILKQGAKGPQLIQINTIETEEREMRTAAVNLEHAFSADNINNWQNKLESLINLIESQLQQLSNSIPDHIYPSVFPNPNPNPNPDPNIPTQQVPITRQAEATTGNSQATSRATSSTTVSESKEELLKRASDLMNRLSIEIPILKQNANAVQLIKIKSLESGEQELISVSHLLTIAISADNIKNLETKLKSIISTIEDLIKELEITSTASTIPIPNITTQKPEMTTQTVISDLTSKSDSIPNESSITESIITDTKPETTLNRISLSTVNSMSTIDITQTIQQTTESKEELLKRASDLMNRLSIELPILKQNASGAQLIIIRSLESAEQELISVSHLLTIAISADNIKNLETKLKSIISTIEDQFKELEITSTASTISIPNITTQKPVLTTSQSVGSDMTSKSESISTETTSDLIPTTDTITCPTINAEISFNENEELFSKASELHSRANSMIKQLSDEHQISSATKLIKNTKQLEESIEELQIYMKEIYRIESELKVVEIEIENELQTIGSNL